LKFIVGRFLSVAFILSLQVSCATTARTDAPRPDSGPTQLAELSEVPFFPDNTTLCGPASLAAVLSFSGVSTNPAALSPTVYLPGRQGALQIEMLSAARRAGAVPYLLPPTQDALAASLKAGYPVVVLLNLGLSFAPSWHYAVLVGMEPAKGDELFILRSGEQRRQLMPAYTFKKTWERSGRWAMIVSSPEKIPAFLPQAALIDALVKFERSAPGDLAVTAYSSAIAAGVKDPVLQMGLANAQEKQGRLEEAMDIWRGLMEQQKDLAAGVNFVSALEKQGRSVEAVAAACDLLKSVDQAQAPVAMKILATEKLRNLLARNGGHCTR
jgi:hypothetical protein